MGAFDAVRRQIALLAGSQHGVVTWDQLSRLGATRRRVQRMVERGELRRLHRGVYLVGPIAMPHTYELAAVLACGGGSAVSHRSGIFLYELLPYPAQRGPVHITVSGRHCRGDEGIVVHEARRLEHYEVRERHAISVTSPTRTLVDFAGSDASDWELERAVAEAFALRLTQRLPLLREAEMRRGRRGTRRLRRLLEGEGPKRTRSAPERKLLRALRAAGVTGFETNARLGKWEVDFYWPGAGLVVEVDAYSTHSSPFAFERDRRKSAALEDLGLRVRRVTKGRIDDHVGAVVAEIERLIT